MTANNLLSLNDVFQYFLVVQQLTMNDRFVGGTGHLSKLLRYPPVKGRKPPHRSPWRLAKDVNAIEHDIQPHMNQYQQVVLSRHSVAGIAESLCSGSCEIDQENDDRDGNYQPGICSHRLKDARYAYSIRCYCILHLKPSIINVLIPIKDYIRRRRVIPWRTLFWQPIGNF